MARLSKTTPFDIYEDQTIGTAPETPSQREQDGERHVESGRDRLTGFTLAQEEDFSTESEDGSGRHGDDAAHDGDDERRNSYLTKTSVSSMPPGSVDGDACQPYTPILSRTPQQRPHSSLGVPLSSPTPWLTGSSKGSMSRSSRSKAGTPRAQARRSPMPRKQAYASMRETKVEQQPLVLLHVKLLPVSLPWSLDLMRDILPKRILDNLQLLRAKATDTVLQRGVLFPHPGDDYELLEERLLEALELQPPRITKCGHFRLRQSTSSTSSAGSDSGIGSSVEGLDDEHCSACHHHISATKGKWWIRVFAANGLMRANTWAAAWSEMERVDVEIMPFISDRLRMTLDEKKMEQQAENGEDIEPAVEEEEAQNIRSTWDEADTAPFSPTLTKDTLAYTQQEEGNVCSESETKAESRSGSSKRAQPPPHDAKLSGYQELPRVYRPRDIPLSILLRNYVLLLARDRRKVAIFFLAVLGLFFALRPAAIPPPEPFVPGMLLHGELGRSDLVGMEARADKGSLVNDAAPAHLVAVGETGTSDQGVEQENISPQAEERGEGSWSTASDGLANSSDKIASIVEGLGSKSVLGGISVPYHIDAFGLGMCMALR